jgi:general secretion pathway protein C
MNIISKKVFNKLSINLLIYIAILKFLNIIAIYFLPHNSTYKVPENSLDLPYFYVRLDKSLGMKEIKKVQKAVIKDETPLTDLVLKAIYANSNKQKSFIMVVKKNTKTTKLLNIGDTFKRYKFVDINAQDKEAIFEKEGKRYTLRINKIKDKKVSKRIITSTSRSANRKEENNVILAIPRKEIFKYRKNFKDIWKNISIQEVLKNGKIDGFEVLRIRPGTMFSKLGLRSGDIIKYVNNNKLKSYADAFKIYYQIEKLQVLKLTILRNKVEKELEYEIY